MQVVRKEALNIEKQLHFLSEADEIYLLKNPAFAKDKWMQKSLHCHRLIRIVSFQRKTILLISGPAKFCPNSNFLKSVEMSELL